MALLKIFVLSFAFFVSLATASWNLPDYIMPCNRSDIEFNECLIDSIESLKPYLSKGIPELSIPKCEPFLLPKIDTHGDMSKSSMCNAFSNIYIWGLTNFTVKSVSYDEKEDDIHLKMKFPNLFLKMEYLLDHFVFIIPLKGQGQCGGNYSNINLDVNIDMKKIYVEDKDYLYCQDAIVDFDVGEARVNIDNKAGNINVLGVSLNDIINEKWQDIEAEMRPIISLVISRLIRAYVNSFFKIIPLDVLMPE